MDDNFNYFDHEPSPVEIDERVDQIRELKKRNTNFVFVFGQKQAGKSVVLGHLAYYMDICKEGMLNRSLDNGNERGAILLKKLTKILEGQKFPDRTTVGTVTEVGLEFIPREKKKPAMHVTFLEMSGEDLREVELSEGNQNKLPSYLDIYFDAKIPMTFLLITDCENASEDDELINDFINYINNKKVNKGNHPRILLIISKWDKMNGAEMGIEDFVQEKMKKTFNKIDIQENTITHYSVGDVVENGYESRIVELDFSRARKLLAWLYQVTTRKSLYPKNFGDSLAKIFGPQ